MIKFYHVKTFTDPNKFIKAQNWAVKLKRDAELTLQVTADKKKVVNYKNGILEYSMISNYLREISTFFDEQKNIVRKIKKFYMDKTTDTPYKEINIDKINNTKCTSIFDYKGRCRECTLKAKNAISRVKTDENEKLIHSEVFYTDKENAFVHDIFDTSFPQGQNRYLKSVIKLVNGDTEEHNYQKGLLKQSIFKTIINSDEESELEKIIKTEIYNFDNKEKLKEVKRSFSDIDEETTYKYKDGSDDVEQIIIDDKTSEISKKEIIDYDGIFNAKGGKIYEDGILKFLTEYTYDGKIAEVKTPEGNKLPLSVINAYQDETLLNINKAVDWEELTPKVPETNDLIDRALYRATSTDILIL